MLQAAVALDAWNDLSVLQHAPWLGRLLSASILRQAGLTTAAHLAAFTPGLKTIPVDRRRHRHRAARHLAVPHGLLAAAAIVRKRVVSGECGSARVDPGGRRMININKQKTTDQ